MRAREVIERQVQHLVCLIDDLLDVSRITRGMITLQRERVLIDAVVARAVETARPLIDARRHELTLDLPEELLSVDGDPTRLVQIIGNILHNAAKFMEPGGRIVLRVAREDSYAVISVQDFGHGHPARARPEDLRPVLAGAPEVRERARRPRHRPGAGPATRGDARWRGDRQQRRPGQGTELVVRLPLLGVQSTHVGVADRRIEAAAGR